MLAANDPSCQSQLHAQSKITPNPALNRTGPHAAPCLSVGVARRLANTLGLAIRHG
jgi:hypothetical protein